MNRSPSPRRARPSRYPRKFSMEFGGQNRIVLGIAPALRCLRTVEADQAWNIGKQFGAQTSPQNRAGGPCSPGTHGETPISFSRSARQESTAVLPAHREGLYESTSFSLSNPKQQSKTAFGHAGAAVRAK